jgi:two-component system CheB/CheR fusion protein
MAVEVDPDFERLVDYVRDHRGFDFTRYKRQSLARRFRKRMQEVGIETFSDYQDYLEVHPDEFTKLFNTILINVTSFFRDDESWTFLAEKILPEILQNKHPSEAIRVWCAGCASGEEAYTLAIVLAEAVGRGQVTRLKIYATDVDEEALAQARAGIYEGKALEAVPGELRERYFEPKEDGQLAVKTELRRAVIFGRHDLVSDAPISRVHLIACRNTLMYFNAEAQSRIYRNFHFALQPHGYLFLGKSETLLTRTSMFTPVDIKRHVYARVSPASAADQALVAGVGTADERLRREMFESATVAQIVLDANGVLIAANGRARSELGVAERDLGRPFYELELSYRPLELRPRLDRAASEHTTIKDAGVEFTTSSGDRRYLDVEVAPHFANGDQLGTSILFTDVSGWVELKSDVERGRRELETAYEELHSTVEELETTNEELQSTNEELETTNEELQSTNEELETMNEELQSTNAELETINTELVERTSQLDDANTFLESVLESLTTGVMVLDQHLRVESWNALAEDLWALRTAETKRESFFDLDIGLPVEQLRRPIEDVSTGATRTAEITVEAVNRRGKAFRCKITASPLQRDGQDLGVILLMENAGT